MNKQQIFLDCDGVLADFNKGFFDKHKVSSAIFEETYGTKAFWKAIRDDLDFFGTLPLMSGAVKLYESVKHLRPIILTGVPFGQWAEHQKFKWRDKYFPGVPMVTCLSKNKRQFAQKSDILVDDTVKHKHLWEEAGGIFVVHTSADDSIEQLQNLKVI